jgi:hypothetical protein
MHILLLLPSPSWATQTTWGRLTGCLNIHAQLHGPFIQYFFILKPTDALI